MKPTLIFKYFTFFMLLCVSCAGYSQLSRFADGPLIKGFGKHAEVPNTGVNASTVLKVAFDVGKAADAGTLNRKFDSLARFINMHVAAGVKPENIQLALVVHGKASFDLLDHPSYQKRYQQDNPNKALITVLLANNTQVILCGQTAAAYEISQSQLIDGAQIALSAMTAHALLQQQGYTSNPF